jgi:hypothetical protein
LKNLGISSPFGDRTWVSGENLWVHFPENGDRVGWFFVFKKEIRDKRVCASAAFEFSIEYII